MGIQGKMRWKIWFLEGGHDKPICRGYCLKMGDWTVCRFKGKLGKKEGSDLFEGGVDTPMHTMLQHH